MQDAIKHKCAATLPSEIFTFLIIFISQTFVRGNVYVIRRVFSALICFVFCVVFKENCRLLRFLLGCMCTACGDGGHG